MTDITSTRRTGLSRTEFVAMVALIMALNSAAIDLVVPAISTIGEEFALAEMNSAQFVITAYMIGFGAAQLVYGPLTDRFGRRPILFGGLAIYIVAAFAESFAPSFGALLGLRLVQGIGAASTRVVAMALVRDRFEGAEMASAMSLIMMVFLIMPILAPNIGSVVMVFGDWHALGTVMALVGLVALVWAAARLPETLAEENRRPLTGARIAEAFKIVVSNRVAAGYTGAMATFFAVLFAFVNQAEQVYTEVYGLGATFTLYFGLVAIFMAASTYANSRLTRIVGMRRLSMMALLVYIAATALHLVVALAYGGVTPFPLFLAFFIVAMCSFGFVPANLNALAMQPMGHVAGVASAVLGAAQVLVGGILGAGVGYLYNGTVVPLIAGSVVLGLASLALCVWAEGGKLKV